MIKFRLPCLVVCACALNACLSAPTAVPSTPTPGPAPAPTTPAASTATPVEPYRDPGLSPQQRAEALLALMTLDEKIGQMTQVEKNSMSPEDVAGYFIGSLLSGGGGSPPDNTPQGWVEMIDGFQRRALETRLGIPLLYAVDAVHGHNNLRGAVIFPHNVGLGAAGDPDLVERIGRATAEEMAATGAYWNFAPVVAVPQDIRWGRTYKAYGENTDLVSELGAAYVRGLQGAVGDRFEAATAVLATPKHFIGDGGAAFGSSTTLNNDRRYLIDQGDMQMEEAAVRALFLPPYQAALDAGALSVMVSFSSWNGTKMHAQKYLLTDVLKGELGFEGILISDWQAIDQIPGNYESDVVTSINAGLDMIMVPTDYRAFIGALKQAVETGEVPMSRIDDAVRRILTVKFQLGLFEKPYADPAHLGRVGTEAHRALAREAVRKSLVLLRNADRTLPLAKDTPVIFVAGQAAADVGFQSGGWTIQWQGATGDITPGTTILDGIRAAVASTTRVEFNPSGEFDTVTDAQGSPLMADVGIAVVGEPPYAEGAGDRADLTLDDKGVIERLKPHSRKLVVVLISGRPLVISEPLPEWEAAVAAWLPGSEGQGVADVLFGDYEFTGTLPYTWPRSNDQLPFASASVPAEGCEAPLFPFGYGLKTTDSSPVLLECATP